MKDLQKFLEGLSDVEKALSYAARQIGFESMEAMNDALSGKEITWSGGQFCINVRTGNLRRMTRMEYPFMGNPLSVAVFNRAIYANSIENGVKGRERINSLLKKSKVSKKGVRYRVIPIDGKFVTVTEKSIWRDTPARPFSSAALESMDGRIERLITEAIERLFE